jgi:C_GCAxxG_C_C family probable redox protein
LDAGEEEKMKSRVKEAERLFKEEGYNCAQAVFLAYSDLYGLDRNTAVRLSSGLGGGVGRMREVCGTVLGMSLLAGLEEGSLDPRDIQAKRHTYEVVQKMAAEFKKKNGSVICRELLGLEKAEQNPMPEARTEIYYKKRPCVQLVKDAAEIVENILLKESLEQGEDRGKECRKVEEKETV